MKLPQCTDLARITSMMKTLQLVTWKRNENTSNIYVSALGGDEMILKPCFAWLFKTCAENLKIGKVSSFSDLWGDLSSKAEEMAGKTIRAALDAHGFPVDEGDLTRVKNKFRGNCGEIMVEMLAENGLLDFIKPGTYEPVDPAREEFFDATGKRNGLLVGIQVKNYSKFNKVKQNTFLKAAAQSDLWLRRDNICRVDDLAEFTTSPCQYIISTSDADPGLEDMFRGSVVFLGPKWLDSKRIQGSAKTRESPKWKMLEEVAELIEAQ